MASMTADQGLTPYQLLREVEQRYLNSQGRSEGEQDRQEWTGVLFRIGGDAVLAPMSMMQEIVPGPTWIHVPGVKSWLRGLANIHGTLVPVVDLEGYLLGRNQMGGSAARRLLVVNDGVNRIGILVPEVMGMKHFWSSDEINEQPPLNPSLQPYITAALKRFGEHYGVFDMRKLFNDPDFQQVAV